MKKTGLGRGLDSLLPTAPVAPAPGDAVVELAIGHIDPNREQPRKQFADEALQQLSQSIAANGVLQPILVAPRGGRYMIIAGERRWRAARMAGLNTIPAIVREWDKVTQMAASLIENIQREDLNAIEEAAAIRKLMEECGLTQEAVSQRLGRSRPAVANLLRLLALPKEMQEAVVNGELTAGHARVLVGIMDPQRRQQLFERTLAEHWSVRQLEATAARNPVPPKNPIPRPLEIADLEDRLRSTLGMKAVIQGSVDKGKIVLNYHSQEELERLSEWLERS